DAVLLHHDVAKERQMAAASLNRELCGADPLAENSYALFRRVKLKGIEIKRWRRNRRGDRYGPDFHIPHVLGELASRNRYPRHHQTGDHRRTMMHGRARMVTRPGA